MKTLRIRTRLCLTLLMCMLFVGKSVAQEEGENLPMSFVYPEAYSELIGYDTKNFDLNMGLADCLLKNYEDAVPKLQRAAKQGEGLAMAVLGDLYAHGRGVKADRRIAMNMFAKGIQAKCPLAHCYRGEMYQREGKGEEAMAEYKKAFQMDSDCMYALWLTTVYHWKSGQYEMSVYGMDFGKAFDYLTKDEAKYTESELLTLAELYYYGRGTGEDDVKKMQRSSKYNTYYYKNGESGRASITDALIILDRLVVKGYEPAKDLYHTVKAEYDERERLSNVVEPPMLTDEGKRYLQRNPRPRRPAIATAGYGEIIVTARISSSGQVTNVSLKKRVLQHLDEAALAFVRRMPPMKPGTKGGFATDMNVNIGITFFPSYSVSMKGYSLVR